jgi:signal transduction histidine kinase
VAGALDRFFAANEIILVSVTGQAFFVLGLALAVQSWRHSQLALARHLSWLAAFGLLLALYEWGDVFIPLQSRYLAAPLADLLRVGQMVLLAVAFACLFQFALAVLGPWSPAWRPVRSLAAVVLAVWMVWAFGPLMGAAPDIEAWRLQAGVVARYTLALPGALLAALALRRHARQLTAPIELPNIWSWLRLAGLALGGLALFVGLVVPPAAFWPARWLNEDTLRQATHMPVTVYRAALGLVLAVAIIRAVEVFHSELDRRLVDLEEAETLSRERERLGRELHDGALQAIYGAGLLLRALERDLGPEAAGSGGSAGRLDQVLGLLDVAVADLRGHIGALRDAPTRLSLAAGLEELVAERHLRSLVVVDLAVDSGGQDAGPPRQVAHVLAIANEALSNVVRHAHAKRVRVRAEVAGGRLRLEVTDDGRGPPPPGTTGSGLGNMRDRARLLGGQLTVQAANGHGTRVVLEAPWGEEALDAHPAGG